LNIDKTVDTTWHSDLLYKLSELQFSTSLIKLIASFLTDRKFKALVEDQFSTPKGIVVGVPQGFVRASILYSLLVYKIDASATRGTHLALFADYTCI
jgi:hypothetical protein